MRRGIGAGRACWHPTRTSRMLDETAIVDEAICRAGRCAPSCPTRSTRRRSATSSTSRRARLPAPTCSPGGSMSTTGETKRAIADAILNSGIRAEKAKWDEYKYYPDQFFEPYLRAPPQGRLRALRPSRHRQARRRPDARAARPQLRLLRRAGRHDLHHRPPAEPGLVDRLRHVPAEHHDRGAGAGACTPARRPPSRPITSRSGRCSAFPTRRSSSAAWRSATRTRPSRRTICAPSARRWKSG